jgi:hypothetical protein
VFVCDDGNCGERPQQVAARAALPPRVDRPFEVRVAVYRFDAFHGESPLITLGRFD